MRIVDSLGIEWTWVNPTRYVEFIELMLFQYFKVTRDIFGNIWNDIYIPINAFQTDVNVDNRMKNLKNITVYIEVIRELKRLQISNGR